MFKCLKDIVVTLCFLTLMALVVLKVNSDRPERYEGQFRVVDGDSVALGQKRMRLWGIDAPEFTQTCLRDGQSWACGQAAKAALQAEMRKANIGCEGAKLDKYRRVLVVCRSGGEDINAALVRMGMALSFGGYGVQERRAAQEHVGLWAGTFETPSDWRRQHKHAMADEAMHQTSFVARLFGMP